jgi:rhamnogalacturonyl hydrolase YesR
VNYRLFGLPHAIRIGTGLRDFWKINEAEGRLWSDGAFMTVPFLVEYGILFGDQASIDEAAKQLLVYARHLQGPSTGLLYHAYDETGRAPWLEPGTRHSGGVLVPRGGLVWNGPRACARASSDACSHAQLLSILAALASGLERFQDSESGRWFQVMDRSDLAANWTETSCSSMHALILLRALDLGYLPARYWGGAKGSSGRSESGLRGCRWGGAGRGHLCWDERRHHRLLPPAAHGYERSSWSWRIPASA